MCKVSIVIPVYNQEELVIRALDSIPDRDDIEIIVIDDCSTDNTWRVLLNYVETHRITKNIVLLYNPQNKGVGYTVNRGIKVATGEYVVLLGSDDYFLRDGFNYIIDNKLNGTDLVYFDLRVNDGSEWYLSEDTKYKYCGSVKFMRRDFIKDLTVENLRYAEDLQFFHCLQAKNPTEKFSNLVVKHYNFPRKDSLSWRNANKESLEN